jgi:hypothetical protein
MILFTVILECFHWAVSTTGTRSIISINHLSYRTNIVPDPDYMHHDHITDRYSSRAFLTEDGVYEQQMHCSLSLYTNSITISNNNKHGPHQNRTHRPKHFLKSNKLGRDSPSPLPPIATRKSPLRNHRPLQLLRGQCKELHHPLQPLLHHQKLRLSRRSSCRS